MKKGFSHKVAPALIEERPGMTKEEVAELALKRGLCGSDAVKTTPVESLGNTLEKEVREGRLPDIEARKEDVLRYYPVLKASKGNHGAAESVPVTRDGTVSVRLPIENIEQADLLVKAQKFGSRSEGLAWLIEEGIKRNERVLADIKKTFDILESIVLEP